MAEIDDKIQHYINENSPFKVKGLLKEDIQRVGYIQEMLIDIEDNADEYKKNGNLSPEDEEKVRQTILDINEGLRYLKGLFREIG